MEKTKKSFLKNMVGFSMVTWISFGIGFIASPIATRLFEPAEYAHMNLFNTYAALFASLCYLGLDQAFVRFFREPPGRSTRAGMLTFCTVTSLGFSVFSSLLLFIGWPSISEKVMGQPDFGVFVCLCVFSFCSVLFRYLSLCYRMEQNAKLYTLQGVIHILLTKIAYLSVGFANAEGKSAILLLTLLMAVFTVIFVCIQRKRFDGRFLARVDKPFLKDMTAYAVPLIPITVITWLNGSVSQLALNELMDFTAVGIYSSALGLASTVNIIQTGFNTYWAPYVYENYKSDNKRRFFTVHRLMACALTIFGLAITLLQAPVFLLLGEKYRSSVVYFPFLFMAPICYCLSETTGMGIGISKKTYWNTVIFLVSVLLNLGLCYLFIPSMGATGAALASAASAVVSLVLRTVVGERYYKAILDYRYVVYTIGLMLLASFGNLWLASLPLAKYALLGFTVALACVLYRKELRMLWQTVWQFLREGIGSRRSSPEGASTKNGEDEA